MLAPRATPLNEKLDRRRLPDINPRKLQTSISHEKSVPRSPNAVSCAVVHMLYPNYLYLRPMVGCNSFCLATCSVFSQSAGRLRGAWVRCSSHVYVYLCSYFSSQVFPSVIFCAVSAVSFRPVAGGS